MGQVHEQLETLEDAPPTVFTKCHWRKPIMSYGEVDRERKGTFPLVRCAMMDSKLQLTNAHVKGLSMLIVMHMGSLGDACVGIVYKTSANDPGVMLNLCPWCGGDIAPRPRDHEQLKVKE
jgi:hypothetical protein